MAKVSRVVRRRTRLVRGIAAVVIGLAGALFGASPAHAATNTTVSLTFDDGQASQYEASSALATRGMKGTFYINSGKVGSSGYYMTWPQIMDIYVAGHEIGGHTLNHANLTTASGWTATAEVCDDRTNLIRQGLGSVDSFAYPYGSYGAVNATAEGVVESCGYSSGRGAGNLNTDWCPSCPYAEAISPPDPYNLRTAESVTENTTLQDLQNSVMHAEDHGGGWVIITFHGVCDNQCTGVNTVTTGTFAAFLDWLGPRSTEGTLVRTIGDVMGSETSLPSSRPPATSIACDGAACSTGPYSEAEVTVSLTATGSSPTIHYTTDGSDPRTSATSKQYTAPLPISRTTTVRYYSADNAGAEPPKSQRIRIGEAPPVADEAPASLGRYVWLPFVVAFPVALVTAVGYLELVRRYPRVKSAMLYLHKAVPPAKPSPPRLGRRHGPSAESPSVAVRPSRERRPRG